MTNPLTLYDLLARKMRCRGFGIQSPNDYAFVRYVLCETWPYYQYKSLRCQTKNSRLYEMYFRLANYRQPQLAADVGETDDNAFEAYVKAGCRKCVVTRQLHPSAKIVRLQSDAFSPEMLDKALKTAAAETILIVEGIRQKTALWQSLTGNNAVATTYDMYQCGVAVIGNRQNKQSYKLII